MLNLRNIRYQWMNNKSRGKVSFVLWTFMFASTTNSTEQPDWCVVCKVMGPPSGWQLRSCIHGWKKRGYMWRVGVFQAIAVQRRPNWLGTVSDFISYGFMLFCHQTRKGIPLGKIRLYLTLELLEFLNIGIFHLMMYPCLVLWVFGFVLMRK